MEVDVKTNAMQGVNDPRIQELEELAAAEGIMLPMPVRLILWFEDHGCVVDLHTGKAHRPTVGTPTPSGKAVAYLLTDHVGAFAL
jgi:hypothetical protein